MWRPWRRRWLRHWQPLKRQQQWLLLLRRLQLLPPLLPSLLPPLLPQRRASGASKEPQTAHPSPLAMPSLWSSSALPPPPLLLQQQLLQLLLLLLLLLHPPFCPSSGHRQQLRRAD